jgi:hypothetical protein
MNMSILNRLFGLNYRGLDRGETLAPRELLIARAPPWNRVPPPVIKAILAALDGTSLLDCFVRESMARQLVSRYESLAQGKPEATVIRAQISGILCRAGFRQIVSLGKAVKNQ